ncbi:MAG: glycosyltransferase family 4 protein [Acidobacteriaceae bacterium]|nr:glycosyltransferase family 4 protein [Acidobacteriaceae bacterium]
MTAGTLLSIGARKNHRRLRVLSVIDGLGFAGDESRLLSMSRSLDRDRFEHSVLTLNRLAYSPADEYAARRIQYLSAGVNLRDLDESIPERTRHFTGLLARIYGKTGIFRKARRLAHLARAWEIDVIDGRLESAGLVGAIAGQLGGIPASITLYGGHTPQNEVTWPWTTRLGLRLASSVITDSRIRADQMRALLKGKDSKVVVIPNGVPKPASELPPLQMRKLLGLPEDPHVRVIGQISRLIEYKGHEVLLDAAKQVMMKQRNVALLCVGYTRREEYKRHLQSLAEKLGIAHRVVITEYQRQIGDVWNVIDVHAHASLFDSLPISIAEGMSLGKPAVVTDAGGIPEMVLHGETGLVVPAGNAEALAEALLRLLNDTRLANQLGEHARVRYELLYRPEVMARAMEQHFAAMADRQV